ncbi:hypothetical protein SteCoe_37545 [Stentor coeruleus]|uniref:Uncharacterized protein n=1 Tax=Stentor coeruleus TaxID=5963 RepID=A0A1R2AMS8_9CILI|nr:hypothetical protein SteCoe_37545 [Stentor coeruleus]
MDAKCFVLGCTIPPSLSCICTSEEIYLCHLHVPIHIQKHPNLNHNFRSIIKIINPDMKEKISQLLHCKQNNLKSELKSFSALTYKILSSVRIIAKNYYSANRLLNNICSKILKEINVNNTLTILSKSRSDEDCQLNLEDIENELQRKTKYYCDNNINLFNELQNSYKELEPYLNNLNRIEADLSENYSSCLYIFKQNTKKLICFDTENLKKTSEDINIESNQAPFSVICCLPGKRLFALGNFMNEINTPPPPYLIDLSSKSVDKLQEARPRAYACSIYNDNKVYIFGGWTINNEPLKVCDAYDLRNRKWNELASSPKVIFHTSLLNLNQRFLVAGITNFMYTYDWNSNSYSEVTDNLTINDFSMLIKDNKQIHFIVRGTVYLSSEDDIYTWRQGLLVGFFSYTECLPVIKGRFAYFADGTSQIYKYSLDSYKIDQIA